MEKGNEPALYKAFLVAFVLIEVGLFSVCVQGWPSLVYIFRDTGFYANLCDNDTLTYSPDMNATASSDSVYDHLTEIGCAPQQEMLNLVYTVASVALVFTSVLGHIYDHCGTWFVRGICMSLCFTGTLLMAFARPGLEWLLFPGSIAQYLGGVMYLATDMQMPQLFPKSKTTLGIVVSGATDMSTSSFLFVKLMTRGYHTKAPWWYLRALVSSFLLLLRFCCPLGTTTQTTKRQIMYLQSVGLCRCTRSIV
ncbi:solute carrier family 43 member 3 [Lingula anatina]|uniref:Solute carrier family 43 member 3 n=1 Tax=Lingula anatina TaxID=7574 RepID=A0A1S3J863_LINAN|nr:solute carrier family 43 member 3 [Lingula anatina]|eukprot:XP_013406054.1 solute carrier family 43 member 3 [Lingula anatina]